MKKNRLISLLLVLAMALSLCGGALAAELEEGTVREGAVSSLSAADGSGEASQSAEEREAPPAEGSEEGAETSYPEEAEPEESTEGDQSAPAEASGEDASSSEQADASDEESADASGALETQEAGELNITETIPLAVEYDDRFSFSEAKNGYVVLQVKDQDPTSFQVSGGVTTDDHDEAVVYLKNDTDAVAVGTGTATVLMVKSADKAEAEKVLKGSSTVSVDAVQVDLEVSPAPLTIMFLGGQSNMEGWGSDPGKGAAKTFQHPKQSVACPDGEVYSTYAPGKTARKHRADSIGGGVNFNGKYCKNTNAKEFLPGTLTGSDNKWSMDGTKLIYPVNQMTTSGNGKTGPDSGLAWEWNKLTGDKVWTVNAAVGSSTIKDWTPGKDCFKRAYAVYGYALQLYKQEIRARHFKASHQLYFWLQGEHNSTTSGSKYWNDFKLMHDNLRSRLASIYGDGWEQMGIITVRATGPNKSGSTYRSVKDVYLTGPRVVQSWLANTTKLEDVHVVSDVNEQWVSDSGVKSYFQNVYGSKLNYKTQGESLSLPTKVSQVHNDIHYTQVAHNENGITAARGMYEVLNGSSKASKVRWRSYYNKTIKSMNLAKGESAFVVPAVSAVSASKTVKWKLSSGLSYSGTSGKVKVTDGGRQEIKAVDPEGNVLSTLVVSTGKALAGPSLKSVSNVKSKKLKASWGSVSGADGYQIQCSLKSDFSSSVKTLKVSGSSATLKNLKKDKTYYVRVRAWMEDDEDGIIYSKWSGKKSVKIKK